MNEQINKTNRTRQLIENYKSDNLPAWSTMDILDGVDQFELRFFKNRYGEKRSDKEQPFIFGTDYRFGGSLLIARFIFASKSKSDVKLGISYTEKEPHWYKYEEGSTNPKTGQVTVSRYSRHQVLTSDEFNSIGFDIWETTNRIIDRSKPSLSQEQAIGSSALSAFGSQ